MANYRRNEVLTDVVLYLQTVLASESLSERAEVQRVRLLDKLSTREISPNRTSYMDMNGRSKGLMTKSNSFACLHQQAAYEELCANQPIYNNVPYEEEDDDDALDGPQNYEPFAATTNGGGGGGGVGGYRVGPNGGGARRDKRHSADHSSARSSSSSTASSSSLLSPPTSKSSAAAGLSSRSSSDSSESSSSRPDVVYVSANAVKYSASKYGVLTRREKILFVDHTRKYWAAVLSCTMYVYNGEKEPKPCLVIPVEGYAARDANGGNKSKDCVFEIVCPGKKTYQFTAQNQKDMQSWIEAINNASSKPSTPEIVHSPSPICFKQDLLPNRELPVPPAAQDYCYDKPNPIIRPVNVYENATDELDMESIYHFIDESKQEKHMLPKIDKQFWDGDTSYYNIPSNIPVPITDKEERNNNDYDNFFAEKDVSSYDVVVTDESEVTANPVLGVQQIIQKIEEINSKKTSPLLRRKSPPKNNSSQMRNSTPVYTTAADEYYEPVKMTKNIMPGNVVVTTAQSFRKSR